MDTRVVTGDDIGELIARVGLDPLMGLMIERLQKACAEYDPEVDRVRERDGFHYHIPDLGLLEWMPSMRVGQRVTVKMVGYHPHNPDKYHLPTILSTVSVYDPRNGHMTGLVDGTFLTALRTGAASVVASRVLARPDSSVVGIIGCGAQAVTQLHGLFLEYPIRRVLINDIDPAAEASLADRLAPVLSDGIDIRSAPLDLMVQDADILVTATSEEPGKPPLFDQLQNHPWLHINAIGSDFSGKAELPLGLLQEALVIPDDHAQARREGECQRLTDDQVGPELWHLVQHADEFKPFRDRLTVFDSTGWSLEDQIAGQMLIELADEYDLGQRLRLERVTRDPLNPYDGEIRTAEDRPVRVKEVRS